MQHRCELRLAIRAHRAHESPALEVARQRWLPVVVDAVAAAEIHIASMDLSRAPAVCRRVQYLEVLGVDATSAERLHDPFGAVDADRSDNLYRCDQARRQREVHCRAAKSLFHFAERTLTSVERHRAGHKELGAARCIHARRPVPLSAVTTCRADFNLTRKSCTSI